MVSDKSRRPVALYTLKLLVDNKPMEFELDTGANLSIGPEEL